MNNFEKNTPERNKKNPSRFLDVFVAICLGILVFYMVSSIKFDCKSSDASCEEMQKMADKIFEHTLYD